MEKQVQTRGREFVHVLLTSFRRRIQPYWSFLMTCQMANPCSPRHMPQSARDAVKDLCLRAGMSDIKDSVVVEELDKQRSAYSRAPAAQERRIHRNLLFFMPSVNKPVHHGSLCVTSTRNWSFQFISLQPSSKLISQRPSTSKANTDTD